MSRARAAAAALPAAWLLAACAAPAPRPPAPAAGVRTGLEVLAEEGFASLRGKRVGLITNRTGADRSGRPAAELLAAAGVPVAAVFSPEHGFGAASEEAAVSSGTILVAGRPAPLHSLYAGGLSGMRPRPEQLAGLDVLLFDIQDAGARFYTYPATMAMSLEEAAKAGIPLLVLDRPNPVRGDIVEGPVLSDPGLLRSSPVAYLGLPTRHGLTMGEMALWHNRAVGHPALTVAPMRGWRRDMWFDETGLPWVPPSPNLPDPGSAVLYSGLANLEFANLSVGRGTPFPFAWFGAPWLDADALAARLNAAGLPGVRFEPRALTPAKPPYRGEACRGVGIVLVDRDAARPLDIFAHAAAALRDLHAGELRWNWERSRLLVGSERFKILLDGGAGGAELAAALREGHKDYEKERQSVLLYR